MLLLAGAAYARQKGADAACIGLLDDANHLFPDQTREFLQKIEEVYSCQELWSSEQEMPSRDKPAKRNIFISFAHEDVQQVNLLRGQAKNENSHIAFNDWSLSEPFDSERAEDIKAGIRERISPSSVTLVYVSENTPASKWVDWEVRESVRLGKGVVAVYSGSVPPDLPQALKELGVSPIPWTQAGLAKAIEDASSKGTPR